MDEFTIRIPRERPFSAVADLVVGGIAARHDITLDVLDDLQLALVSLLEHDETDEREVEIVLRVSGGTIEVVVGPPTRCARTPATGSAFAASSIRPWTASP
jgi:hypothetical protein